MTIPSLAMAAQFHGGEVYTVGKNERIAGDTYSAGERATISGTVDGDVVAVGGAVVIEGTVVHDLIAAGGTITITGTVQDDVRVAGGTVTITGSVRGDLFVAGGEVHLSSSGAVDGDVIVAGGTITIDGPVKGNIKAGGGKIRMNSQINGSVDLKAGNVTLGSSALIGGDFRYSAKEAAVLETGAQVRGATTFDHVKTVDRRELAKAFFGFWLFVKLICALVAALVLALVFRRYTHQVIDHARQNFAKDFLAGFVTLFMLPVASILSFITLIGIPFGILALLIYATLIVLAVLIAPIFLGSWLYMLATKHEGMEVSWKTVLFGVLALYVVKFIPFVGGMVSFVLFVVLFGALIRILYGKVWKNRS